METATIDQITELTTVMRSLLAEQKETNRLLRMETKEWYTPEEAADYLGIPFNRSQTHRRKLASLYKDLGYLPQTRPGSPPSYHRKDLQALSPLIAAGKVGFVRNRAIINP